MSLIWKFEEDLEMAVQFHVDMFHSIPENETVKKIATWKTRHNANATPLPRPPVIRKSVYRNITTCAEVIIIGYRNKERLGDWQFFLSKFFVLKMKGVCNG